MKRRILARLTALAIVMVVFAACSATLAPPIDRDRGPDASAERDGISVELWLDRRVVAAGERLFALVRVSNRGPETPTRETNVCGTGPAPARVVGRGDLLGRSWEGPAGEFKQLALSEAGLLHEGELVLGQFIDLVHLYSPVPIGCPAISIPGVLGVGEVLEAELGWDAVATAGDPLRPGPAAVIVTFTSSAGELSAEAAIEITGGASMDQLTVADHVDAALANDEFRRWLDTRPRTSWSSTSIVYWPNPQGEYPLLPAYEGVREPVVEIGLFREVGGDFEVGSVIIDRATGEVIGTLFEP